MIEYLVAARAAVILLAVMPSEILFDAIEAKLGRRGVELRLLSEPIRCESSVERHVMTRTSESETGADA
jgi:hypothetical protein